MPYIIIGVCCSLIFSKIWKSYLYFSSISFCIFFLKYSSVRILLWHSTEITIIQIKNDIQITVSNSNISSEPNCCILISILLNYQCHWTQQMTPIWITSFLLSNSGPQVSQHVIWATLLWSKNIKQQRAIYIQGHSEIHHVGKQEREEIVGSHLWRLAYT